jgi:hypothetical protein
MRRVKRERFARKLARQIVRRVDCGIHGIILARWLPLIHVQRAGGCQDEMADSRLRDNLSKISHCKRIVAHACLGFACVTSAARHVRREMQHRVQPLRQPGVRRPEEVPLVGRQCRMTRQSAILSVAHQRRDFVSATQALLHHATTEESGRSRHPDSHTRLAL